MKVVRHSAAGVEELSGLNDLPPLDEIEYTSLSMTAGRYSLFYPQEFYTISFAQEEYRELTLTLSRLLVEAKANPKAAIGPLKHWFINRRNF